MLEYCTATTLQIHNWEMEMVLSLCFWCVHCICRFLAVNSIIVYLYFTSYQKLDEEDYGGLSEILKEGLMTSFASFLVSDCLEWKNVWVLEG